MQLNKILTQIPSKTQKNLMTSDVPTFFWTDTVDQTMRFFQENEYICKCMQNSAGHMSCSW